MEHPERQVVFDALDKMPDVQFAGYMKGLAFANAMLALAVLDDPSSCVAFAKLIAPFVAVFGDL